MGAESQVIQVVFDAPLRRSFDYLPPAGEPLPRAGMRVRAPFGRRPAIGVVAAVASTSDPKGGAVAVMQGWLDALWQEEALALTSQ